MSKKNDVKKVTIVEFHPTSTGFKGQSPLEETKDKIPEEPSSDSSESVESLSSEEHKDYLDVEELILYLIKIKKVKE